MRLKLKLSHKGWIIVGSLLLFELTFVGMLWGMLKSAENQIQEGTRIRTVLMHLTTLSNLMQDTTMGLLKSIILPETLNSDPYMAIVGKIPDECLALKTLLRDHPDELHDIRRMEDTIDRGIPLLELCRKTYDADKTAHHNYLMQLKDVSDQFTRQCQATMNEYRRKEDQSLADQAKAREQIQGFLFIMILWNIALAVIALLLINRGITNRLNTLQENSVLLAIGKPLKPLMPPPMLGGADEITNVDHTFHQMAEALAESERKEKAVIDNTVDVICSIGNDGKFTAVSPASLTVWGFPPDELIGRRYTDLMPPEDREAAKSTLDEIIKTQAIVKLENRVVKKDNSIVDVLLSAHWSNREKSLFCVAHDVTDRKRAEMLLKASENRIRQIIEHLPIGVITIDTKGDIESINPRTEEIFGYTSDELIGKNIWVLYKSSTSREGFLDKLKNEAMGRILEMEAQRKSEETFPVEMSLNRFQTQGADRYLVHVQDITERRAVEKLKREFVAMISHDLRTPLMSVEFSLSLLSAGACGDLPERAQENVSDAENNIGYVMTLINGLLDVEKISSGKLEMRFAEMNIASVLERSQEAVKPLAEKRKIGLYVPSNSVSMYGDENRLVQVLVNLLSNALKFSPAGSNIEVAVGEPNGCVEVQVTDHGTGIPANQKEKIFGRFERTESAKKVDGVGLGLSICKVIIEQHAGEIGVESEEGKGSTFWFRVPKEPAEATAKV